MGKPSLGMRMCPCLDAAGVMLEEEGRIHPRSEHDRIMVVHRNGFTTLLYR